MDESTRARIAEAAPAIVALHDLDRNILWANDAYCEAAGRPREEIAGMKCWRAWGLEEACRGCPVIAAIETGRPAEAELTPWNQEHWPESQGSWLSKAAPVRDAGGRIAGVVEVAFDITEKVASRRRSEQQLRASNQQLRASNQQLQATEQQLQATEQQLRASNQQLQATEQQLRAGNQELRRFEWLNDKEQAISDAPAVAYTPPYGDVTALNTRRVVLDAVGARALGEMARDLMDLLDTSVAVYEANGDYAYGLFDSTWCRKMDAASFSLCRTDDARAALACGEWLCHENCWNDSALAAIRSGAPTDIECVGGIRLYAVPILAGGECVGAVNIGYGAPPTDERKLRALSERFGVPLDELSEAAWSYKPRPRFIVEVAKRRCRTVARMMGDAVEKSRLEGQLAQSDRLSSMGMLAAGVAHEINNPLAYTLYNLESVVEDLPGVLGACRELVSSASVAPGAGALDREHAAAPDRLEELMEQTREALDGAQRIRTIARTLATFSRIEHAEEGPVDIRRAAEHAGNMARNEAKYRARLQLDLSPAPRVLGSEGKLAQVFLNLLINAAHAIEEGDVQGNEIRVRTYADGDWAVAEVRDTGKGIAKEDRARLFDPFFTTKALGEGSGLGLSISEKIITEMGGEIRCESEVGRGSTFTIRLPAMPADRKARPADRPRAKPAAAGARGRVLAVDDEPGIRSAFQRMLGRDGHEVVTASSGEEGKKILDADQRFDVIVLDLMMPQVSGMELHRWLAENHPALAERVVFVTGGVFTPRARAYLSENDNLLLEKPLDIARFCKIVNDRVATQRAAPPPSR